MVLIALGPTATLLAYDLSKYGYLSAEIIEKYNYNTLFIDIYEIVNDELYVLANIPNINNRDISVYINNEKIETESVNFPQRDKYCFDELFARDHSFEFRLPLNKDKKYIIEFKHENNVFKTVQLFKGCRLCKN